LQEAAVRQALLQPVLVAQAVVVQVLLLLFMPHPEL